MQIDGDVEALTPQPARDGHVIDKTPDAGPAGDDDQLVQVRIAAEHGGRRRLDDIREVSRRKVAPQRVDDGGGEDDVADEAKADEKNLQGSTVASSMSMTGMSSLMG